jgi:hypothetical protein
MLIVVYREIGFGRIARTKRDNNEDSGLLPHLHVQGVLRVSSRGRDEDSLALSELDCAANLNLGLGDLDHVERIPFEILDVIDIGLGIHDDGFVAEGVFVLL